MKQGQFSQEQIVAILHEAERGEKTIRDICHEYNLTETTFYRWRKIYGGMSISEAQHLKELQKENARLKRLLAERDLEIDALKEYLAKKETVAKSSARFWTSCADAASPCAMPAVCWKSIARPSSTRSVLTRMPTCARHCAPSQRRNAAVEPKKRTTTCADKASGPAPTASTASGSRNTFKCGSGVARSANHPASRKPRFWYPRIRDMSGRWIFSSTPLPKGQNSRY